jgi:hypothetical protein
VNANVKDNVLVSEEKIVELEERTGQVKKPMLGDKREREDAGLAYDQDT